MGIGIFYRVHPVARRRLIKLLGGRESAAAAVSQSVGGKEKEGGKGGISIEKETRDRQTDNNTSVFVLSHTTGIG